MVRPRASVSLSLAAGDVVGEARGVQQRIGDRGRVAVGVVDVAGRVAVGVGGAGHLAVGRVGPGSDAAERIGALRQVAVRIVLVGRRVSRGRRSRSAGCCGCRR